MKTYKQVSLIEKEFTDQEIEEQKLYSIFVFSLPRSGSSMMSTIVEALGVNLVYTSDDEEELQKRNENERKRYGDSYQMNRLGFREITKNIWESYFKLLSKPFSGCKMIIPVNHFRMDVVKFNPNSKVIQMWRDPEEMRQSQQASYKGDIAVTDDIAEHQRAVIRTQLVTQKLVLEQEGIDSLHIQYRDVLNDPNTEVRKVAKFIGVTDEEAIKRAIACVKPKENRFKIEELEMNI